MKKKSLSVPKAMQERYDEITAIIKDFCQEHLNNEYETLCCQLCAALCRKRPSPVIRGKADSWACGIVHAIGMVNFLFDSSGEPHMKAKELYSSFGVNENTGGGKSKKIRDIMKIKELDVNWTLPSRVSSKSMTMMQMINDMFK